MAASAKITPNLWFNMNAEEAVAYYVSVISNSKIQGKSRYGKDMPGPEGAVMAIRFQLAGQEFIAINGGPEFKPNEAVSFYINCDTQGEIDAIYDKLVVGGKPLPCGWLQDKFGIVWQVNWSGLQDVMTGSDRAKADRVMHALMEMKKVDLGRLKQAAGK